MDGLGFNIEPDADWSQVASAISLASRLRADAEASRANALRWQGSQEYQSLVASGVPPEDALRRTAHLLFYNEPSGIASIMRSTRQGEPWTPTRGVTEGGIPYFMSSPRSAVMIRPEPAAPVEPEVLNVGGSRFARINGRIFELPSPKAPLEEMVTIREPSVEGGPSASYKIPRSEWELRQAAEKKKAEVEPIQSKFNEAKAKVQAGNIGTFGLGWLGNTSNLQDMLSSSNALRQAGIEANTGLPLVAPPLESSNAMPASLQPTGGRVRVKSPNGKIGSIPAGQLDAAKRQGYTVLE